MLICKCNRCNKEIAPVNHRNQKYDIYRNNMFTPVERDFAGGEEVIHLCPECTEAFDKFLDGGKVV